MLSSAALRIATSSVTPVAEAAAFAFSATFSIIASVGSRPRLTESSSPTGQFGRAQLGPCSRSIASPVSSSITLSRSPPLGVQQFLKRLAKLRWARGDADSSRLHRRDLAFRVALAARYDRAGMAHAAARR